MQRFKCYIYIFDCVYKIYINIYLSDECERVLRTQISVIIVLSSRIARFCRDISNNVQHESIIISDPFLMCHYFR